MNETIKKAVEYPSVKVISDLIAELKSGNIPADIRYEDVHYTDNYGRATIWLVKDGFDKYKVELYPNNTVTISRNTYSMIDNPYRTGEPVPVVTCEYKEDADEDDTDCLSWYALCKGEDDADHGTGTFIWKNAVAAVKKSNGYYDRIVSVDPKDDFCRDIWITEED